MSIPGFKEREIDQLIPDERVDDKFSSTRAIFRVMHPLLQAECLSVARRHKKHPSEDPTFKIPTPFSSHRVVDTMYGRWGSNDKARRIDEWEEEKRIKMGEIMDLYSHGIHLISLEESAIGQIPIYQANLSPVGKAVVVAGGLDEAAFIEFLRAFPFDPEDSLPGLGDFYHDRLKRAAHLGLFAVRRPRLSEEDITLIVENYNWIPSYMTSK